VDTTARAFFFPGSEYFSEIKRIETGFRAGQAPALNVSPIGSRRISK
jgi:hypothetical protein